MSGHQPLAITGYAYRAPGAGRSGLWEFLAQGEPAWPTAPADPQNRLLLECAFEAAESAGLAPDALRGARVAVFASADVSGHRVRTAGNPPVSSSALAAAGLAPSMAANRLSRFFGLAGPSVFVDAACAGSSYAVHLACQSIWAGKSAAALVGAVGLVNDPEFWSSMNTLGALSVEGESFSLDSRASEYGKGEGGGCLIIKPLSDALACGDTVRAVIRNTTSNHSGRTPGITNPSRAAQEKLLLKVHRDIGWDPKDTPFIESYGAGTQAGDLIEASTISSVLASGRSAANPVYIGAVKSNLGHLEAGSGIIFIIKCVMMLERGVMLPNHGFEEWNPNIENHERLAILTEPAPWPADAFKRVCASNFGFGGSNVVVLLEAAPSGASLDSHSANGTSNGKTKSVSHGTRSNGAKHLASSLNPEFIFATDTCRERQTIPDVNEDDQLRDHLFVFSSESQSSLETYLSDIHSFLQTAPNSRDFMKNLAYTLGQRRTHFPYRIAVVADSVDCLRDQLHSVSTKAGPRKSTEPIIAFTFTGQGAQYFQMAHGLRSYGVFDEMMKTAEQVIIQLGATWSLRDELDKPEHESRLDDAEISQPACTAIQIALVALLHSWGITPSAVIGHSSGEIASAFAAGLISFQAAIAVAYFRGVAAHKILEESAIQGCMLAVGASTEEAEKLFDDEKGYATVAAINSPESVTISGDVAAITHIQEQARRNGLFERRLKVSLAYHSNHMEREAASYLASIKPYCLGDPPVHSSHEQSTRPVFVSSVTGQRCPSVAIDAGYWVKNLSHPVQYLQGVEALLSCGDHQRSRAPDIVIEIGPHSALRNATKQIIASTGSQATYLPSIVRGKDATRSLLELAGNLYTLGRDIKLDALNRTNDQAKTVIDLPPHQWDKSTRYIPKDRVSERKLHVGGPYNPLLGWKSPRCEGSVRTFRNQLTLDDLPWIRDHKVNGDIVLPFAGFMSLAIEGMRRLDASRRLRHILVREFHMSTSLRIQEEEQVDITTRFRPAETGTGAFSSTIWAFEIMTWAAAGGWKTHCHGFVEADDDRDFSGSPAVQAASAVLGDAKLERRDVQSEYATLKQHGSDLGASFRNMIELWQGAGVSVATIKSDGLESESESELESSQGSPVTVYPPIIDSMMHTVGILQDVDHQLPRLPTTLIPTYCAQWRVSNDITVAAGQLFTVVGRRLGHDKKSGTLEVMYVVFELAPDGSSKPVVEIGPLKLRAIGKPPDWGAMTEQLPESYTIRSVPCLDLIDPDRVCDMIQGDTAPEAELQIRRDMDTVGYYFISRMLQDLADHDLTLLPRHFERFLGWARSVVAEYPAPALLSDATAISELIPRVAAANAQGAMMCAVGRHLASCLRGEKDPLALMLKDDLLGRSRAEDAAYARSHRVLAEYVGMLVEINPDLQILEIGAGTAGAAQPILEAIQRAGSSGGGGGGGGGDSDGESCPLAVSYTFSDVSAGLLEEARTKLAPWPDCVTYKTLDISQDPVPQGFDAESFDVVIASNALHGTPDIDATLRHVHRLLKPNGRLGLVEYVARVHPHSLCLPLLPGWWLAEDRRRAGSKEGPVMGREPWDAALRDNGFSGLEARVDDYSGRPEHTCAAMWSVRRDFDGPQIDRAVSIDVYQCSPEGDCADFTKVVADTLVRRLSTARVTVKRLIDGDGTTADPASLSVFLDSKQHSIFENIPPALFYTLRNVLTAVDTALWVVPDADRPDAATAHGILRTLRHEAGSKTLLSLDKAPPDEVGAEAIARLVRHIRDPAVLSDSRRAEQEYGLVDGLLHVPRLVPLRSAKRTFTLAAGIPVREEKKLGEGGKALELTVDAVGSVGSGYFRSSDVLDTDKLGDDEVLIQAEVSGLSFLDLMLFLGSLPWCTPGFEGAGRVVRVGSQVNQGRLQVGDRVFYFARDSCMANFVRLPSWRVHRVPHGLTTVDAASMPTAFFTAIASITYYARLQAGESILIHSASGAVGQACIMLAQHLGAEIYATAGAVGRREFLTKQYGIPADHIFSSRSSAFKDGILNATKGRGVDVIVNSLSGELLQQTWDLIAEHGRFVEIGKKDRQQNSYLPMRNFLRNVSVFGVDLRKVRPDVAREWMADIARMTEDGIIGPIRPVTVLSINELQKGLRKLQDGQNIGKIMVTLGPDETVLAERVSPLRNLTLRPDATYLITGGTGGIGRAMVARMVARGARHVVLLGRSGSSNPEVDELLRRYGGENPDVQVRALACDVGSRRDLLRVAEDLRSLPKVRGIIHGPLYLRSAMFENCTYEDWKKTTAPKAEAAWNLHELFPDLDFFVSLASIAGIVGTAGQSIYNSTTSYLDAFSKYRARLGLPAVTVHLPIVEGVGYAFTHNMIDELRKKIGTILTEDQAFTLIEGAMMGSSSGLNVDSRSISFSLPPKSEVDVLPWERFNMFALCRRQRAGSARVVGASGQGGAEQQHVPDECSPDMLLGVLCDKVSAITMMDKEEITPSRSLVDYGLDSLISLELRNWIRRTYGVDMEADVINSAKDLKSLADLLCQSVQKSRQ